jgi:hypothetical protein
MVMMRIIRWRRRRMMMMIIIIIIMTIMTGEDSAVPSKAPEPKPRRQRARPSPPPPWPPPCQDLPLVLQSRKASSERLALPRPSSVVTVVTAQAGGEAGLGAPMDDYRNLYQSHRQRPQLRR